MIPANQLRVGNKILSIFDKIETVRMILGHEGFKSRNDVNEIYKHLIGVEENGNQYNLAEINPIPLTEEWLLKFGFEWDIFYQGYTDGNWVLNSNHKSGFRIAYGKRRHDPIVWKIEYVNQLQNLYFALTGTELNIKQP